MSVDIQNEHPAKPVWFYRRVGREYGPVDLNYLKQLAAEGRLDPRLDFIRHGSNKDWLTAADLDSLYEHLEKARADASPEAVAREAWKKQPSVQVVEVKSARVGQWSVPAFLAALSTMVAFGLFNWFLPLGKIPVDIGKPAALFFAGLGLLSACIAYAYFTCWVYHGWRVTNQYGAKIPAWLAALLMWVPGVHLIWSFIALWWWSRDFNVILSSHPQYHYVERPSEGWLMAYCVYPLLSPVVYGLVIVLCGYLSSNVPFLSTVDYLIACVVNIIAILVIQYKAARSLAMAVDGIHDLNMRQ